MKRRKNCFGAVIWILLPSVTAAFVPRHCSPRAAIAQRRQWGPSPFVTRRFLHDRPPPRRVNNSRSNRERQFRNDDASRSSSPSKPANTHPDDHDDDDDDDDDSTYLATCIPGLATVLQAELTALGCRRVEITASSAVRFTADTATALATILWCRTAHKVLQFIADSTTEPIVDRDSLYEFIRRSVPVPALLGNGKGGLLTLAVSVVLNNARYIPQDLNHSHFSALTIKNALCDAVRDLKDGERPDVDTNDPDVPLVAVVWGDPNNGEAHVTLYRQLHTGSLHKRGYRQDAAMHKAAMKESMAAGLLLAADWPGQCRRAATTQQPAVLVDPMAGSGSLLLEGAMMAADLAPGLMRIRCGQTGSSTPPMVRWKHAAGDKRTNVEEQWRQALMEATERAKRGLQALSSEASLIQIHGNDMHPGALDILENSLQASGLSHVVHVYEQNCRDWKPSLENTSTTDTSTLPLPWTVVTNPPWGVRLTEDMHEAWEDLRVFVREHCPAGSQIWVLSGNPAATKHLGLRKSQSLPIKTGQQDLRWIQYILRGGVDDISSSPKEVLENKGRNREAFSSRGEPKAKPAKRETVNRRELATADRKETGPGENEWLI